MAIPSQTGHPHIKTRAQETTKLQQNNGQIPRTSPHADQLPHYNDKYQQSTSLPAGTQSRLTCNTLPSYECSVWVNYSHRITR
jgi:hypothetical protein